MLSVGEEVPSNILNIYLVCLHIHLTSKECFMTDINLTSREWLSVCKIVKESYFTRTRILQINILWKDIDSYSPLYDKVIGFRDFNSEPKKRSYLIYLSNLQLYKHHKQTCVFHKPIET